MFLIPIVIILGIILFSFAGDIVKNLDLGIPALFSSEPAPLEEAKEEKETKAPAPHTPSPTPAPSRAPPPAPLTPPSAPLPPSTNSPYYQKVKISSVQATTQNRSASITLRSNMQAQEAISITGWRVKSTWSGEFTIPHAFSYYHPSLSLPPKEPIVMKQSGKAYLLGQASPLGRGANFKTNACFGYLKKYYPALPGSYSCSQNKPKLEDIKHLTPLCQEFILKKINYGSCIAPDYSKDPAVATNTQCIDFINSIGTFTYEACYQKRYQEQNFLSPDWHVYMDASFGHPLHDAVYLYDQNGLLVDTYLY
ncbi:MAG: hypothetical protein HYT50_02050 [Candidatus Wildermuthbacteria bacterium]|nr:hypothetical protein [Candidatus Wildermuthbacteria bacterium]